MSNNILFYVILLVGIVSIYLYFTKGYNIDGLASIQLDEGLPVSEILQRINKLRKDLYNSQIEQQKCHIQLARATEQNNNHPPPNNQFSNPLLEPNRIYNNSDYNQLIGYIFSSTKRYPLIGRHKYPGRTDRWEYYVIDESENKLRIPLTVKGDTELFSGDSINVPELAQIFTVKLYEYETYRYNPKF